MVNQDGFFASLRHGFNLLGSAFQKTVDQVPTSQKIAVFGMLIVGLLALVSPVYLVFSGEPEWVLCGVLGMTGLVGLVCAFAFVCGRPRNGSIVELAQFALPAPDAVQMQVLSYRLNEFQERAGDFLRGLSVQEDFGRVLRANVFIPRPKVDPIESLVELYMPDRLRTSNMDCRLEWSMLLVPSEGATGHAFTSGQQVRSAKRTYFLRKENVVKVNKRLKWMICTPLIVDGSVMAVLNLDGLFDIEGEVLEKLAEWVKKDAAVKSMQDELSRARRTIISVVQS